MSHELRTPLNSLLMLSKLLSDNAEGNLTDKQIKFARTIHGGGSELLSLINDILDLSKIESGTVTLDIGEMSFDDLRERMERTFGQVAQNKRLGFAIEIDPELPQTLRTDEKRLQQVIKNLLSNAFKFTDSGEVTFSARRATEGWSVGHPVLSATSDVVALSVTDTGVGIPEEKQQIIFEAFQQADGTTNRKYGGTGLGLSISRELAGLLGGEITIRSEPGSGSSFTLYLPLRLDPQSLLTGSELALWQTKLAKVDGTEATILTKPDPIDDDRHQIQIGDWVALIVDDDSAIADVALEAAHTHGFKGLVTRVEQALQFVRRYRPHVIMLGIEGADMDGWALLDLLKHDAKLCTIPVQIVSAAANRTRALLMGAFGFTPQPSDCDALSRAFGRTRRFLDRSDRSLVVFGSDEADQDDLTVPLADRKIGAFRASCGPEALQQLALDSFDALLVDLRHARSQGLDVIEQVRAHEPFVDLPVIALTNSEEKADDQKSLRCAAMQSATRLTNSIDQMMVEVGLCLHRNLDDFQPTEGSVADLSSKKDPALAGRKIAVIDDDFRNIFSLTSALEQHDMDVLYAETGREGIELLKSTPDIDLVLVDVMMPEMDGYETMQQIRSIEDFADLPIIAVTAKAMKGDREKCIEAGASDYLAKPVEIAQLLSLLRVWLYG